MDYSSYMEIIIFRTAAILGFRRLQSYMLPCLYALLVLGYDGYNSHILITRFQFSIEFCKTDT